MKKVLLSFIIIVVLAASVFSAGCDDKIKTTQGIHITDDLPPDTGGDDDDEVVYSDDTKSLAGKVFGDIVRRVIESVSDDPLSEQEKQEIYDFTDNYLCDSFENRKVDEDVFLAAVNIADKVEDRIVRCATYIYSGINFRYWYSDFKYAFSEFTNVVGVDLTAKVLFDTSLLLLNYGYEVKGIEECYAATDAVSNQVGEKNFCEIVRLIYSFGDVAFRVSTGGGNAFEGYGAQDVVLMFRELSSRLYTLTSVTKEGWEYILTYVARAVDAEENPLAADIARIFVERGEVKSLAKYMSELLYIASYTFDSVNTQGAMALIQGNYKIFSALTMANVYKSDLNAVNSAVNGILKDEKYLSLLSENGLQEEYEEYTANAGYATIFDVYESMSEAEADKNLRGWLNKESPVLGFLMYDYDNRG